jgi:hypothetical protein
MRNLFGRPEPPGDGCKGAQLSGLDICREQKHEHQVYGLAIDGIKVDRLLEPGEKTAWLFQSDNSGVWNGDTTSGSVEPRSSRLRSSELMRCGDNASVRAIFCANSFRSCRFWGARTPINTSSGERKSEIIIPTPPVSKVLDIPKGCSFYSGARKR